MSVYKPKRSPYWHYDFVVKGQRFFGTTGCESKREAQACERRLRNERAAFGASHIQQRLDTAAPEMTLDVAFERWWLDCGERLDSAVDRQRQLALWLKLLGKDTRLASIRESDINTAIRKRRALGYRGKLPSDATVNRFVAALRAVWRHLDSDESPLPRLKWGKWIAKETAERAPELSDRQLDLLDAALSKGPPWAPLMGEIAYTYGLRAGELFFNPDWFDPEEQKIRLPKTGRKKPVTLTVALLPESSKALAARWSRAQAAGLAHVWFDEREGRLVPVSRSRADYQLRKALRLAGLRGVRIHDLRHHAATRLLRATEGNLKLVKEALGHAAIQSTVRYAHVSEADLRAGFARISRACPEPASEPKKKGEA